MARENIYSKAVVWVKVILPLLALGILSSLFLLASTPDPEAALPYAEVDIDEITREQRVSEPRFAGVLGNGQEMVLTADTVISDRTTTDRITAQTVAGRIDLSADAYLLVDAATGNFDMTGQQAVLSDGVILQSSDGFQLNSAELQLALNRLDVHAPRAVHITGPGLDVTANTMDLSGPDGETILRFNGEVRVLYDPQR